MLRVGWMVSSGCRTNGSGILNSARRLVPNPASSLNRVAISHLPVPQLAARAYSSILTRTLSLVQTAAGSRLPPGSNWSPSCKGLLLQGTPGAPATPSLIGVRTVTKFSRGKGIRKSVKAVLKRFKRLEWGAWIRTKSGRHKKLWKKTSAQKRRLRQHVFTNSTQSWLLDSMVTSFWRRPKHYVNDPYRPYHSRDEFVATRRK